MSQSTPPPGGGYGSLPPLPPGGGYDTGGYGAPAGNSKKAVWSLVLGIAGLVCCSFLTAIPAIVLGKQAQKEIDASGGRLTGRGMATAGFVLGVIATVFGVIYLILVLTGAIDLNFYVDTGSGL